VKVGVLALQGGFRPHAEALSALGADAFEVRLPRDLAAADALVLPGGESTTIGQLLGSSGLLEPLRERLGNGMPVLGTCAGMIVLARQVLDGRPDQPALGAVDIAVRRNAHGGQQQSFEAPVHVGGLPGGPFPGVFIRAPGIETVGPEASIVATLGDGTPVAARQGAAVVCAFHPELSGDLRLHEWFLSESERAQP
jgi:5'-phosphate synthase pdxT subunit